VLLPIRTAKMVEVVLATISIIQLNRRFRRSSARCRVVLMHKFKNRRFQHPAAPIRVEAADRSDAELFLLLALAVGLRRVIVSRLGLIKRLGRLLLCAHMIVAAVLLRRSPVNFRGLLVMLGGFLVHFLRHFVSLPID
jgi:hypothetical protein